MSKDKIIMGTDPLCKIVAYNNLLKDNKCSFSISYAEGSSLKGVFINEIVRFGKDYKQQKGTKVPIGCTTNENNLFYTQDANGIMGLSNGDKNFINISDGLNVQEPVKLYSENLKY